VCRGITKTAVNLDPSWIDFDLATTLKDRLGKPVRVCLQNLFSLDYLYLGGGNTKKIVFELPAQVKIVPNVTGLLGGIALWRD